MKNIFIRFARCLVLASLGWFTTTAHAQFNQTATTGRTGSSGRGGAGSITYPNNTTVGEATFSIDPETRRIIVITDEDTNLHISQVISNLDRPKPQVLIKVVFLEVTHSTSLDLGLEGAYSKNLGNSFINGLTTNYGVVGNAVVPTSITPNVNGSTVNAGNMFGLAASGANPTPPGAGIYSVLGKDYSATLRAIATAGKTEVLSRPSILARNSQPATISVGEQVPLITNTRTDTLGNQINTVSYQNVGIILKVTPFITSYGMVEMIIAPESSQLEPDRTKWVPISSGSGGAISAPVINSSSADTVVVVPDGQTAIIGGLMQRSKGDSESKIPFLGDIPYLGNLFKHKQKNESKTELVIFLTPYIVQAPSQLAGLTAIERDKSATVPKGLSEVEVNQFLDGLPVPEKKDSKSKK